MHTWNFLKFCAPHKCPWLSNQLLNFDFVICIYHCFFVLGVFLMLRHFVFRVWEKCFWLSDQPQTFNFLTVLLGDTLTLMSGTKFGDIFLKIYFNCTTLFKYISIFCYYDKYFLLVWQIFVSNIAQQLSTSFSRFFSHNIWNIWTTTIQWILNTYILFITCSKICAVCTSDKQSKYPLLTPCIQNENAQVWRLGIRCFQMKWFSAHFWLGLGKRR